MSSLVVPRNTEQRNPTTEIAVGFGDVSHISPWRVKRRFPRSGGGERAGQLVTLRDALLALNEFMAKDEEMPEHAFLFGKDGALESICDIPLGKSNGSMQIGIRFTGPDENRETRSLPADALSKPVRDFTRIEFFKVRNSEPDVSENAATGTAAGNRKSGDAKTIVLPGGAKMEMIWCGPGSFMMGSPLSEIGRFNDEPLHPVKLTKCFWLGKYEVMQTQWESVMGENRSHFKGKFLPVDSVSWDDCQMFIRKVNVALGGVARLPTEAEWEYACRAGSAKAISGNGRLPDMAWYDGNSNSHTHEVGTNHPNAWGFFDMHGNVLEWCSDWFSVSENQTVAVDPLGPPSGSFRVLRGGCWFFYERDCRSDYRLKRVPCIRNCIFGFRLACSEKEQQAMKRCPIRLLAAVAIATGVAGCFSLSSPYDQTENWLIREDAMREFAVPADVFYVQDGFYVSKSKIPVMYAYVNSEARPCREFLHGYGPQGIRHGRDRQESQGRLRRRLAKRIATILPRCKGVWLRDPQSAETLGRTGFPDAKVAADTAILMQVENGKWKMENDGDARTDRALLEKLGVDCIDGDTPESVLAAAATCDVVLSSRLHLLILAANVGTPGLGIARGSKLASSATWRRLLVEPPFDEAIQYSEDVEWTWRNSRCDFPRKPRRTVLSQRHGRKASKRHAWLRSLRQRLLRLLALDRAGARRSRARLRLLQRHDEMTATRFFRTDDTR